MPGLDLAGLVLYDIGVYRGLLTMFFASRARSVLAFEPNPVSNRRLLENIALNALSNVEVMRCGLGATDGEADLVFDARMAGGASADPSVGYIELHGATLAEKRANAEQVVAFLNDVGYREIAHVETGTQVTIDAVPPEGHLYCPGRRPVSATVSQRTTAPAPTAGSPTA